VLHGRVLSETEAGVVLCLPDGTTASVARSELYALMRSETAADAGVAACAPPPPTLVALPTEAPVAAPLGQQAESARPLGLAVLGAGSLAVGYLVPFVDIFATANWGNGPVGDLGRVANWLYVPVLGPMVAVAVMDSQSRTPPTLAAFAIDALVQLSGAALLVTYFLLPKRRASVPDAVASPGHPTTIRWSLTPGAGRSPAGLTLSVLGW
jgi:hypothetical protein